MLTYSKARHIFFVSAVVRLRGTVESRQSETKQRCGNTGESKTVTILVRGFFPLVVIHDVLLSTIHCMPTPLGCTVLMYGSRYIRLLEEPTQGFFLFTKY